MAFLYLIRHCLKETDRNRFPMDDDTPLSPAGWRQRAEVGEALREDMASRGLDKLVLVSSAQVRARQTLDGILPSLQGMHHNVLPPSRALNEINKGPGYALSREERQARWPQHVASYEMLMGPNGKHIHPLAKLVAQHPEGESVHHVWERTVTKCRGLLEGVHPQLAVVLVSSEIPLRAIVTQAQSKIITAFLEEKTPAYGSIRLLEGEWGRMRDHGYVHTGRLREPTHAEQILEELEHVQRGKRFPG